MGARPSIGQGLFGEQLESAVVVDAGEDRPAGGRSVRGRCTRRGRCPRSAAGPPLYPWLPGAPRQMSPSSRYPGVPSASFSDGSGTPKSITPAISNLLDPFQLLDQKVYRVPELARHGRDLLPDAPSLANEHGIDHLSRLEAGLPDHAAQSGTVRRRRGRMVIAIGRSGFNPTGGRFMKWRWRDSNPRLGGYEPPALTTELHRQRRSNITERTPLHQRGSDGRFGNLAVWFKRRPTPR